MVHSLGGAIFTDSSTFSSLVDLSSGFLPLLKLSEYFFAQSEQQNLPEPKEPSCSLPQYSHFLSFFLSYTFIPYLFAALRIASPVLPSPRIAATSL